jgi:hypothetical protein
VEKEGQFLVSLYPSTLLCSAPSHRAIGGTNKQLDLQNPDNLGQQSTDNGVVPNLKWSFSDSKTRIFNGGWVREQVITDLPQSHDIAAAQQHLKKGALRELHWHRVVRVAESGDWCILLTTYRPSGVSSTMAPFLCQL